MAEMKKVPAVRFNKFSDDWVESELDSLFSKIKNAFVGTATPYYVNEGHFYLESNNVKNGQINRNSEVFINDYFYKKQQDNLLHAGDIVMVQSGHVGHSAVISPELNNTAAHALIIFADKKRELCSYFLNYQFQTDISKKEIASFTTGNTIKHILSSDMKKFRVLLPVVTEQTQIGSYFQHLAKLISLHQTKINKLTNLKKAMLEKMFPKQGADVPEIRFKGFAGAWDQKEVSTLLSERNTQAPKSESYPLMAFVAYTGVAPKGDRYNREFLVSDEENKKYKQTERGDFIYSSNNLETGSIGLNNYGSASISPVYSIFEPTEIADSDFIGRLFVRKSFINEMVRWRQGVVYGQWRIHASDFLKIEVSFPKLPEQRKIGKYFKNLDNLITLHQTELEKLTNLKKACLDKMFV